MYMFSTLWTSFIANSLLILLLIPKHVICIPLSKGDLSVIDEYFQQSLAFRDKQHNIVQLEDMSDFSYNHVNMKQNAKEKLYESSKDGIDFEETAKLNQNDKHSDLILPLTNIYPIIWPTEQVDTPKLKTVFYHRLRDNATFSEYSQEPYDDIDIHSGIMKPIGNAEKSIQDFGSVNMLKKSGLRNKELRNNDMDSSMQPRFRQSLSRPLVSNLPYVENTLSHYSPVKKGLMQVSSADVTANARNMLKTIPETRNIPRPTYQTEKQPKLPEVSVYYGDHSIFDDLLAIEAMLERAMISNSEEAIQNSNIVVANDNILDKVESKMDLNDQEIRSYASYHIPAENKIKRNSHTLNKNVYGSLHADFEKPKIMVNGIVYEDENHDKVPDVWDLNRDGKIDRDKMQFVRNTQMDVSQNSNRPVIARRSTLNNRNYAWSPGQVATEPVLMDDDRDVYERSRPDAQVTMHISYPQAIQRYERQSFSTNPERQLHKTSHQISDHIDRNIREIRADATKTSNTYSQASASNKRISPSKQHTNSPSGHMWNKINANTEKSNSGRFSLKDYVWNGNSNFDKKSTRASPTRHTGHTRQSDDENNDGIPDILDRDRDGKVDSPRHGMQPGEIARMGLTDENQDGVPDEWDHNRDGIPDTTRLRPTKMGRRLRAYEDKQAPIYY